VSESAATNPKVFAALIKAQEILAAEGISKDRTNTFDNSKFRGIDDLYNAASGALVKARLNVRPTKIERKRDERPRGDRVTTITLVEVTYTFTSAEDCSSCDAVMHAEGVDTSDKSTGKAMSYCYKQLLFQVFCIPIEGQNVDSDDDKPEVPAKQQQRPAAQTRASAATSSNGGTASKQLAHQPTRDERYENYWPLFKNSSHVVEGKGQPVANLQDEDLASYIARLEKARDSKGTDANKPFPYRADALKYLKAATRIMKGRMPPEDDFRAERPSN
jgi:hypothetical protein